MNIQPFTDYTEDGRYVWFLCGYEQPGMDEEVILTRWEDYFGIDLEDDGYIRNVVLPVQRALWTTDDSKITWCRVVYPCEMIWDTPDAYSVSLGFNV